MNHDMRSRQHRARRVCDRTGEGCSGLLRGGDRERDEDECAEPKISFQDDLLKIRTSCEDESFTKQLLLLQSLESFIQMCRRSKSPAFAVQRVTQCGWSPLSRSEE